ncbi:cytochrome c oxidase copper chaperone-like [Xenia sp. Carnegie-2017]|uniref:cytochrome c oxidase copper chaperone-like n=1 Tax=Xenia sp. Carnegie-2017 TaxID=2897299 RepID=UPI001F04428D|nr:cytochrome c oxidase copper chaperone-like [Xenia sp. Carnegie-2017]
MCKLSQLGIMSSASISLPSSKTTPSKEAEKKLKPCCACPETKKERDACIMEKGEINCQSLIEAHKQCMRQHGFNI